MAGLMQELITTLEQECSNYEILAEISKQKTPVIVQGDISELQKITAREQDITSVIQNLETKRIEVTKDIAIVINRDVNELSIDKLIESMEDGSEDRTRLQEVRKQLKAVLKDLSAVNEQNGVLLKQSLEMVEFDIALLKSMRQAPETANYNNKAYNTGTLLGSNGFDMKQ